MKPVATEKAPKALRHIYALFLIMIGWLIFSIEDLETMNIYFKKMFMNGLQCAVAARL